MFERDNRQMASKKFTCNEVLGLLFADPDSEGEYLSSEDDGQSFSVRASHASVPCNDAAGPSESVALHQAPSLDPLPNTSGGENNSRGRSVHRGGSRRGGSVGNRAGSSVGTRSFHRASQVASVLCQPVPLQSVSKRAANNVGAVSNTTGYTRRGRSVRRRVRVQRRRGSEREREEARGAVGSLGSYPANSPHSTTRGGITRCLAGRGRDRGGVARSRANRRIENGDGNAGFQYLANEEQYETWIRPFDCPIGYRGERELSNANSPLDFLSLFLSDDFWNLLTTETNQYAHQFLASHQLKPHSRFHAWSDVTVSEMKVFLALHLSMGLVEKSELEDYWADYWPTATPGFGKVMSRNRFELILSFLHFANNEMYVERGQPGYDRLFKIRPIIELIIPKFAAVYGPGKQLSLDEMTLSVPCSHWETCHRDSPNVTFCTRPLITQIVWFVLIGPALKAAVRQNTGVGSVGWVSVLCLAMRGTTP